MAKKPLSSFSGMQTGKSTTKKGLGEFAYAVPQGAQKEQGNIWRKISHFGIGPATTNIAQDIGVTLGLQSEDVKAARQSQQKALDLSSLVAQKAGEVQGPAQQRLLDVSRQTGETVTDQPIQGDFSEDIEKSNLRRGLAAGGELGTLLATPMGQLGTKTVGQRIGSAALAGGEIGAIRGLLDLENESIQEAVQEAIKDAVTGAAAGAVVQFAFETPGMIKNGLKKLAGKTRKKAVEAYGATLKENVRDKKFYKQAGGRDKVAKDAIDLNIPNTQRGVIKELDDYGPKFERKIQQGAQRARKQGKTINIQSAYKRAKRRVLRELKDQDDKLAQAKRWFEQNDDRYIQPSNVKADPLSANRLRQRFDKETGNLLMSDINSGKEKAVKTVASELRREFKGIVGLDAKKAIRRYHLLSGLSDAMRKEPRTGIVELTGAAAGPLTGVGNIFEFLASKAARSPGLRRAASKTVVRGARPGIKQTRNQAIQRLLNQGIRSSAGAVSNL